MSESRPFLAFAAGQQCTSRKHVRGGRRIKAETQRQSDSGWCARVELWEVSRIRWEGMTEKMWEEEQRREVPGLIDPSPREKFRDQYPKCNEGESEEPTGEGRQREHGHWRDSRVAVLGVGHRQRQSTRRHRPQNVATSDFDFFPFSLYFHERVFGMTSLVL